MTNLMTRIHNSETNEIIDREMTDEEFAEYTERIDSEKIAIELINAKENHRASALAKLAELGLTPDEIAAL